MASSPYNFWHLLSKPLKLIIFRLKYIYLYCWISAISWIALTLIKQEHSYFKYNNINALSISECDWYIMLAVLWIVTMKLEFTTSYYRKRRKSWNLIEIYRKIVLWWLWCHIEIIPGKPMIRCAPICNYSRKISYYISKMMTYVLKSLYQSMSSICILYSTKILWYVWMWSHSNSY